MQPLCSRSPVDFTARTQNSLARRPSCCMLLCVWVCLMKTVESIRQSFFSPPCWLTDRKARLRTDSIHQRARSLELKGPACAEIDCTRKQIQLCWIALCALNNLFESSPTQYFLRPSLNVHEAKCDQWSGRTQPSLRPFSPSASPLVCVWDSKIRKS